MPNTTISAYAAQLAINSDKKQVVLVGRRRLQLEATARYLAGIIPLEITWVPSEEALALCDLTDGTKPNLIILDWLDVGGENGLSRFKPPSKSSNLPLLALLNVVRNQLQAKKALEAGFRGIFYDDDSPQVLARGISALLSDQLWYSREVMSQILIGLNVTPDTNEKEEQTTITPREREILACMKSGLCNSDIARQLCISPNTVRTHICNIFAKINVPNRVQAILWAAKNLNL